MCEWGFGGSSDNLALKEFHWKAREEASKERQLSKSYSSQRAGKISPLKVLSFLRESRELSWIKKVLFSLWKLFCLPWHKHSSSYQHMKLETYSNLGCRICLPVHNILPLFLTSVTCFPPSEKETQVKIACDWARWPMGSLPVLWEFPCRASLSCRRNEGCSG